MQGQKDEEKMSKTEMTAEDLAEMFEAFNRHDADAVMTAFADDCVFNAVGGPAVYGTRFEGRKDIRAAFAKVWEDMPDARWDHHSHFVHGDRAVSEWTFSGTNREGMRVEAQGADLFTLRDGKIVFKQAFRKNRPMQKA
jgi:taurine dehydrogenase small subunit